MDQDASKGTPERVAAAPAELFRAFAWIGPMLMILGAAVGSGEILAEPAAGALYGGGLAWVIIFAVLTKAIWNEAIGRVSIVTGQNFLESCSGAGPVVAWVPWAWYAVNVVKDFFLRGGIVAIAGLICYDVFGPLPLVSEWFSAGDTAPAEKREAVQMLAWTFLNYALIWLLLVLGGYRLAEGLNTGLCLLFTVCLVACAAAALPRATGELAAGLAPSIPSRSDELLMIGSLIGIVMSGSTTVFYSAWAEERGMGLLGLARRLGRRLTRREFEPRSDEEVRRMRLWLRVNRFNVSLTYLLGALICFSTFILGVAVLRPEGVRLTGAALAPELSLMMTRVAGPWAKGVFYIGAWAAVISTAIGILDGSPRMFLQPLRKLEPSLFARLSSRAWHRILMTLMMACSWAVYVAVPNALGLVVWMGAIDAPLVGILFLAYAYLGRRYLPRAYRSGLIVTAILILAGVAYLALGTHCLIGRS